MNKVFHVPGLRLTFQAPCFLVETRAWKVSLEPVPDEEGRFHAHSSSRKRCPKCGAKHSAKAESCIRCKVPLEPWVHLVDVRKEERHCPCEDWTCRRRGAQGDGSIMLCKHQAAAMFLSGFLRSEMA